MSRMAGTDAAAVELAQAGDREAFRELVDRHSRAIFRLAYRMTGNEHDAEEVVQETFLRAFKRLDRFEARASFGTWLHRIGANCAFDLIRARQRHQENREPDDAEGAPAVQQLASSEPPPDRLLLSGELGDRVNAALEQLSERERSAFVLRHYEGMSIAEIGRILKLRENATKNSIFRAVQKLRHALESFVGATR